MAKTQRSTSATFATQTIDSITDVSVTEATLSETALNTDAADAPQAYHIDGVHYQISITTTDVTQKALVTAGDTGQLVVVRKDRANGRGDAAGSQTETFPTAVFTGFSDAAPTTGNASFTMNFVTTSADGTLASQRTLS